MEVLKILKERFIKLLKNEKMKGTARDEQTGICYELESEAIWDIAAATFSVLYLLAVLVLLSRALFDIYYGQNQALTRVFSEDRPYPDSPLCRLIAYAVIGGGLGGVVNGFRSVISWHSERRAFSWRFMWKYVTLPPLGAVLAAIVYALAYSGIGVLGAGFAQGETSANQALSAFAVGALSGYGSQKVFKWLDEHVNKLFSIALVEVEVPDLMGKNQEEAETTLKKSCLKLGKVEQKVDSDETKIGKVVNQEPRSGSKISRDESVDITIATRAEGDVIK